MFSSPSGLSLCLPRFSHIHTAAQPSLLPTPIYQADLHCLQNPPSNPTTSYAGKTILITGATSGLGLEAAVKFASLGASRLILGVRSLSRGQVAKEQIYRRANDIIAANNSGSQRKFTEAQVVLYELDMLSFSSVKRFAEQVCAQEQNLHVAVLNAGIAAAGHEIVAETGFESTIQINVLSTALLAVLLYPKLQSTAKVTGRPTHLEFVGSVGHRMVKVDDKELDRWLEIADNKDATTPGKGDDKETFLAHASRKEFYQITRAYMLSKLLLMYVMDGLVSASTTSTTTSQNPEVIILTTCPNLCRTTLGRDFPLAMKIPNYLFQLIFARSAEEGARILVSGTSLGREANGAFWSHDVFDRYVCYFFLSFFKSSRFFFWDFMWL